MTVRILTGDMRERLRELPDASVDAVVTDPPYHLTSIVKRFGSPEAAPARRGKTGAYARASRGFMGQTWDGGDVAFRAATWAQVLRVMKPGAHLVAFSGTRTYHRMVCAIEDAGFEIRDQIAWLYGSGFPKSHDVSNGIDRHNGDEREKVRVDTNAPAYQRKIGNDRPWMDNPDHVIDGPLAASAASAAWEGWGTALKPALEPIVLARKPLVGSVAANVLAHGTGAINVDGCRVPTDDVLHAPRSDPANRKGVVGTELQAAGDAERNHAAQADSIARTMELGRWPANVVHDGGDEVVTAFPDAPGQLRSSSDEQRTQGAVYGAITSNGGRIHTPRADSGSAARFFYSAKADQAERHAGCHDLEKGNTHPTVKPVDLMRWLVRLITPPGGTVLDPFMGSGSTLIAADAEQFNAIGVEMNPDYVEIARRRLGHAAGMFADVEVSA